MSLKPTPIPPVPEETARVARAAFSKSNVVMQLRNVLGTIYTDDQFSELFPPLWLTRRSPVGLAMVSMLLIRERPFAPDLVTIKCLSKRTPWIAEGSALRTTELQLSGT